MTVAEENEAPRCQNCGEILNTIEYKGWTLCPNCGYCIDRCYSIEAPYTWNDDNEPVVQNAKMPSLVLGYRTSFNPKTPKYRRLHRTGIQYQKTSDERKITRAIIEFQNVLRSLEVEFPTEIYDDTIRLISHALPALRFKKITYLVVVCLYLICSHWEITLSLRKIASKLELDDRMINNHIRYISLTLDISPAQIPYENIARLAIPQIDTTIYEEREIYRIVRELEKENLSGKSRRATVAAVIYLYTNNTQSEIARSMSVSEVTIRNRMKFLKKMGYKGTRE
jgi:transcription initiation factor TFIIIB Brf1 subunit/transcription initiation factor TFIIB